MSTQLGIASGTLGHREHVICKLDEILHFKSSSSPEGVYLPAGITGTRIFCMFCTTSTPVQRTSVSLYDIHTRTRNLCKICTTAFFHLPGTSVSSVRPCHNTQNFLKSCRTLIPVSETSVGTVRPCHNTRNFWNFCKTFIPVPGTSESSLRHWYPYHKLL